MVRCDEALDIMLRLHALDLEKMNTWTSPKSEAIGSRKYLERSIPLQQIPW